jgi:hypothetical protein
MTVEKCAELVGYDWKTVQKRIPLIEEKLKDSILQQNDTYLTPNHPQNNN